MRFRKLDGVEERSAIERQIDRYRSSERLFTVFLNVVGVGRWSQWVWLHVTVGLLVWSDFETR